MLGQICQGCGIVPQIINPIHKPINRKVVINGHKTLEVIVPEPCTPLAEVVLAERKIVDAIKTEPCQHYSGVSSPNPFIHACIPFVKETKLKQNITCSQFCKCHTDNLAADIDDLLTENTDHSQCKATKGYICDAEPPEERLIIFEPYAVRKRKTYAIQFLPDSLGREQLRELNRRMVIAAPHHINETGRATTATNKYHYSHRDYKSKYS